MYPTSVDAGRNQNVEKKKYTNDFQRGHRILQNADQHQGRNLAYS